MSSAIEVLKDFLEQARNIGLWVSDEQEKAFDKALLALVKQEEDVHRIFGLEESVQILEEKLRDEKLKTKKLKEWLEKEIQKEMKSKNMHWKLREDLLKEVLEKVGEQK